MLAAALSVVFHGASAVLAHPLKVEAFHHCEGHNKVTVVEHTPDSAHGSHHHSMLPAPSTDNPCEHHGKIKDVNSCCSAVSAAVLPFGQTGDIAEVSAGSLRAVLAVTGDGHAPPTPSKPPRQSYQS